MRLTVHRSRIKGILIVWRNFRYVVRRLLCCELRAFAETFSKTRCFSIWRRSDRCDTQTAIAFVSRETIVSVTLNMLISLLKDRFRLSKRRQNVSYAAAFETGFLTAKKLCQSILSFKAGQVLLTRKNGVDVSFKKLLRPSLIANDLTNHRFGDQAL